MGFFGELDSAITLFSPGSLAVLLLLEKFSLTTSTESRPSSLLQNRTPPVTQTSPLPSHKERICSRLRLRIQMKKAVETAGRSTQCVCSALSDHLLADGSHVVRFDQWTQPDRWQCLHYKYTPARQASLGDNAQRFWGDGCVSR